MGGLGEPQLMSGALGAMIGGAAGRLLTVGHGVLGGTDSYGFRGFGVLGALTPTEFLGGSITQLLWDVGNHVYLNGGAPGQTNSGWSSMNLNGTVFLRADATFASALWTWTGITVNPIPVAGAQVLVTIA
jgi:hypothetical protein